MIRSMFSTLVLAAGLVSGPATAQSPAAPADTGKVERLTDAMVEMMPFGKIFEMFAADPQWPFGELAERAGAEAVACVRGELSTEGYRRHQKPLVQAHVQANPGGVDAELALLEGGAASLMGMMVLAGAESERTGVEADEEALLASATPAQIDAFTVFFSDPAYAGLRRLAGLGDALGGHKTQEENEAAGQKIGSDLASQLIAKSLQTCGVDLEALQ